MYPNSRQASVMDFLRETRLRNPFNHIAMILDNFSAHRTENVAITSEILDIELSRRKTFCENWMETFVD